MVSRRGLSDKPAFIRRLPRLDRPEIARIRTEYQSRRESLLAVDEGVGAMVAALRAKGELDNTLFIFTSDNGLAILLAWHERQIAHHLEQLAEARDQVGNPGERLGAVLEAYALISHESRGHNDPELVAFLHRDDQVAGARQQVSDMIRELLAEGAEAGALRNDVAPEELATYCLHALTAASSLPSKAAVRRLVTVTLAGLRPPG